MLVLLPLRLRKFFLFFAIITVTPSTIAQQKKPLFIPDTISGNEIELNLIKSDHTFYPGIKTQTMGVNGSVLGPTLLLNKGQWVNFTLHNQLGEPTTMHWHGLHVSPENDGGPHIVIEDQDRWQPSFEILDHASTYWYHPHYHHKTHDHVQMGIAGFILVRDSIEQALDLPKKYGIDDIPLVLQTKAFDSNKQIILEHTASDSVFMVNGTINASVLLPSQVVRLRLLNGSSERSYYIGLSNNQPFHMIAGDASLLPSPVSMTRLLLAPGERSEILVDLSIVNDGQIELMNYGSEMPNGNYGAARPGMGMQTIPDYNDNILNGSDFSMLSIEITAQTDQPVTSIPESLVTLSQLSTSDVNQTRDFVFTTMGGINGPFMINNQHFEMDIINFEVPFENIEVWELRNQTPIAHPFHIHNVPFTILEINGNPPPAHLRGLKDVVLVPAGNGTVKFITKFTDFYHDSLPYMYHCHMLTHEDHGMMGQFLVTPPCSIIETQPKSVSARPEESAQFTVSSGSTHATNYQWQANTGFGFTDLQNAGQYSGAHLATLTVQFVTLQNHNTQFRCIVTSNQCTQISETVTLNVHPLSVGLLQNDPLDVHIYPNPAQNFITIEAQNQKVTSVVLTDVLGKTIQKWEDQLQEKISHNLDLTGIKPGFYFLQLKDIKGSVYVRKIQISEP